MISCIKNFVFFMFLPFIQILSLNGFCSQNVPSLIYFHKNEQLGVYHNFGRNFLHILSNISAHLKIPSLKDGTFTRHTGANPSKGPQGKDTQKR